MFLQRAKMIFVVVLIKLNIVTEIRTLVPNAKMSVI